MAEPPAFEGSPDLKAPLDGYEVLAAPCRAELRVARSRFLAEGAPASDEAAARAEVARANRDHHDARHVCWAWRGGGAGSPRELRHDAGEPSGTAGEPILAALRHAGLTDAVLVVSRWFGGVKLGTAGLARAYGAAAAAALAGTCRRTVVPGREAELVFPYPLADLLGRLLAQHGGRLATQEYGGQVRWRIWLPDATRTAFALRLAEATAGAVRLDP